MVDLEKLKTSLSPIGVVGKYVKLVHSSGDEYSGCCPFHDDTTPSFYVNEKSGQFFCHGCGAKGDMIDFVARKDAISKGQAINKLNELEPEPSHITKQTPSPYKILPVPEDANLDTPIRAFNPKSGRWVNYRPVLLHPYFNDTKQLIGAVLRLEIKDSKVYVPIQWGEAMGEQGWIAAAFSKPRFPYGIDKLIDQDQPVVVVEGEKAADALQDVAPEIAALSWAGGTNSVGHTDWSCIYGKRVVLWPDADGPGRAAMNQLAEILRNKCEVLIVNVDDAPRDGWDAADAIDDGLDPGAWIKTRVVPYGPPPAAGPGSTVPVGQVLTEDYMTTSFVGALGAGFRYVDPWGHWMVWDGKVWSRDEKNNINESVREHLRTLVSPLTPAAELKRVLSKHTVGAVEGMARGSLPQRSDDWDRNSWVINTPSGVVDLRTGIIKPNDPGSLITRITSYAPDTETQPVRWLEFLDQIMDGDQEVVKYLQRLCGYLLTGSVREKMLAFCWGTGDNGKSVFIDTLMNIWASYSRVTPIGALMDTEQERHPTEIAMLRGIRLASSVETEDGKHWAESKVAMLTGGDRISARFMRQDLFEFDPTFKLLIAGNHKPALKNVNTAMKRRMHMIPFKVTIPIDKQDKNLKEKLFAEGPSILGWAIQGCLDYQADGLAAPSAVTDFTEEYLSEEDDIGQFIAECCDLNGSSIVSAGELYTCWKDWATKAGMLQKSQKWFGAKLKDRGLKTERKSQGQFYEGLILKEQFRRDDGASWWGQQMN